MILDNAAIDRLAAYAKSIGAEGSALGIKSTVQPMQRVKDGATGVDYYGIANSTDIDLEDEVVVPDGANRAYIQANGKMFADHKYGQSDVVGKIRAYIPVMSGGSQSAWKVRFHLASTDAGMTAAKIIDELGGIGLSVGFFAKDYGPPSPDEKAAYSKGGKGPSSVVRAWDWFELSTTCLPANKACQAPKVTYDEKHAAQVEELVTKGTISRVGAHALGLPITPERTVFRAQPMKRVAVVGADGKTITLVRRA
jgi:hypothetical protein